MLRKKPGHGRRHADDASPPHPFCSSYATPPQTLQTRPPHQTRKSHYFLLILLPVRASPTPPHPCLRGLVSFAVPSSSSPCSPFLVYFSSYSSSSSSSSIGGAFTPRARLLVTPRVLQRSVEYLAARGCSTFVFLRG